MPISTLESDGMDIYCEIPVRWMSLGVTDNKSTMVQVRGWCLHATSQYLSQCWLRSLSPVRRQAIILANAGIMSIWYVETNFSDILIKAHLFLFKKMHLKIPSAKFRPWCLGPSELRDIKPPLHFISFPVSHNVVEIQGTDETFALPSIWYDMAI